MFWGNWDKRDEWLPEVTWAGLTGPQWASGHSTVDPLAQNPLTRPPWACLFSAEQPLHCTSPSSSYVRLLLLRMKHSRVETTVQRWSVPCGPCRRVVRTGDTAHAHKIAHTGAHVGELPQTQHTATTSIQHPEAPTNTCPCAYISMCQISYK